MSDICRLCLRNEDSILKNNIFDLSLSDTFYWIYGVEVNAEDPYSKFICKRCQNITNYIVRVRKEFQTNQYILKEKKCPLDYDVDFSCITKDVGTITEDCHYVNEIISSDNLSKLSQPSAYVRKLEYSNVHKNYERISKCGFKKRLQSNKDNSEISSSSQSTDPIYGGIKIRPVLISRATNTTNLINENMTTISSNTLRQLFSPTVYMERLEERDLGERFTKLSDVTYRLNSTMDTQQNADETKRLNYMDYYYRMPTSALKELIIKRHNELRDDRSSIDNCKEKEAPWFKPSDESRVESCKQCNQKFKTKAMLNMHCHFKHKKKDDTVVVPKPRKRRKRLTYGRNKQTRKKTMEKLGDEHCSEAFEPKPQPKKITELFSSFNQSKLSYKQLWLNEGSNLHTVPSLTGPTAVNKKLPAVKTLLLDKARINKSVRITLDDLNSNDRLQFCKSGTKTVRGIAQPSTSKSPGAHVQKTSNPKSGLTRGDGAPTVYPRPEVIWLPEPERSADMETEDVFLSEYTDSCDSSEMEVTRKSEGAEVYVAKKLDDITRSSFLVVSVKKLKQKNIDNARSVNKKQSCGMNL